LDSAGAACSVALVEDGRLRAHRLERRARGQAERLMPMVLEVAAEARATLGSVDLFAATIGPGAFTGLRIGLATLRGLALAAHRPMLGVTTLETIAAATLPEERAGRTLLVLIESRRAELYAQSFAPDLAPLDAPRALPIAELVATFARARLLLAGDGAQRAEAELRVVGCDVARAHDAEFPDAAIVATLAAARASEARFEPPAPLYLRPADTTLPKPISGNPRGALDIVAATSLHAELLAALHAAAFGAESGEAWPTSSLAELLAQPGTFGRLAQGAPNAPLGFVLARVAADECEILTIATIPVVRRRGVAAALLEAVLDEAARRGATAAYLEVARDNRAAQALYRRAGFVEVGRRPGYYRNIRGQAARDALILHRGIAK
jgi:tRNA threonylcarbamoyladenosine biosynthesis protein TsaB